MTRADDRRGRLVRIRTVEHRIAQQELARARNEMRQIERVIDRIKMLARENTVATGDADGASLAAISEMSMRLAYAHASTTGPLDHALQRVSTRQSNNMQATVKAENSNRFLEKAVRRKAAEADARENAARCFRRIVSGDEL